MGQPNTEGGGFVDEQGLWRLFFATGSPWVWLAIRRLEQEQQAVPAAAGQKEQMKNC